ncbi:hypothetical protein C0581_04650 [Candidatus Parcubacteria bacterium]|nr:MAG: hypothetical protein C0581_04650 [Candidatus Parcubacteria bacterium]
MIEQDLEQLGFHKNEVIVYLALFELGKVRAGEIIESTNLHRNLVYTALEVLVRRELVTKTTVKGVAVFSVNSPDHLLDELDRKRQHAQKLVEELKSRQQAVEREITLFEGLDGAKRATRQNFQADKGETVYLLGASTHEILPELSMRWRAYHKKRIEKGIKFKALYGRSTNSDVVAETNKLPMTDTKYMPTNIDAPMWFNICGDTSSIVAIDKEPVAINIKSKPIADGLKQYFDHLWNQKVSTFVGENGFDQAFDDILQTLGEDEELLVMGIFDFDKDFSEKIKQFHVARSKKRIRCRMLLNAHAKQFGQVLSTIPTTYVRYMKEGVITPAVFLIYKDKTLISIPDERIFLQIENENATKAFKAYFKTGWDVAS